MSAEAQLRIAGPATEDNSVAAEVLVRAIEGMQQCIWLLASEANARELKRRFKPEQALRQHYTLRLQVPQAGSYALPLSLVDERAQPALNGADSRELFGKVAEIWEAISSSDEGVVASTLGASGYLRRLLQTVKKMLPGRGDRWTLAFGTPSHPEVVLTSRHRETVDSWLSSEPSERETSVIGELQRIDFASNRLWILYPPSGQEIECSYLPELEESILLTRRVLLQVTGRFVLDDKGHPSKLMDVRTIEAPDLGRAELTEFEVGGRTFALHPPVVVAPQLEPEEQQLFEASVPDFGFHLSGRTREELLLDFFEHMAFAWQEYAEADPAELSDDALRLRDALRQRVQGG